MRDAAFVIAAVDGESSLDEIAWVAVLDQIFSGSSSSFARASSSQFVELAE